MSVEENLRLSKENLKAYNEHDLDRLVKLWADEKVGLARKEFQKNFWLTAFPDTHMEVISWTAQDDRVVLEAIVSATHLGSLKLWVTEPIPPTKRKIVFPVCELFHWENGKLKDLQAYLDRGRIMKQLGIEPKVDWDQFS
jgi:predicted ester cyclase